MRLGLGLMVWVWVVAVVVVTACEVVAPLWWQWLGPGACFRCGRFVLLWRRVRLQMVAWRRRLVGRRARRLGLWV